MDFVEFASYVGAFLTVISLISVVTNVVQFVQKRDRIKEIRSQMQTQYNQHFSIARKCTSIRQIEENYDLSTEEKYHKIIQEVRVIQGIADSARLSIIAYSREHVNHTPFFEHPAFPGQEVSDEVRYGMPPEKMMKPRNEISTPVVEPTELRSNTLT